MKEASLQKRVDGLFKRIGGMSRTVCVRTYVQDQAEDFLIGRGTSSSTFTDITLSPQPVYKQLSSRELMYLTAAGRKVTADDYKITISPLAISLATLQDPTSQVVLKGTDGSEEGMRILYVDPDEYLGGVVLVTVIARSVANTP